MLPSWAVLALRSSSKDKALSASFENNRYRNWSLLGGPGARHFAIADSRGLLTANENCGSIDIWISGGDEIIFPALTEKDGPRLRLISTEDQMYEWRTDVGPVEIRRLVYHVTRDDGEYVYNEIAVRNLGLEDASATVHVVIRPMSPLGFEPIETIEYGRGSVSVNSTAAVMFDALPDSVVMARANDEDLLRKVRTGDGRFDSRLHDNEGLATVVLTFKVRLGGAGADRFFFISPIGGQATGRATAGGIASTADRDSHVESWFGFSEEHTSASFPDDVLDSMFQQCLASLAMQVSSSLFPVDVYHPAVDWHDRARILQALIQGGCESVVRKMVKQVSSRFEGEIGGAPIDMVVPLTWALLSADAYGMCPDCFTDSGPFILACVDRILDEVERTNAQKSSSDLDTDTEVADEALLQHYARIEEGTFSGLETQMWLIATMVSSLRALRRWNELDRISAVDKAVEILRESIHDGVARVKRARWPRPQDPVMQVVDSEILGVLSTIGLLGISDIDAEPWNQLAKDIEKRRLVKGLWKTAEDLDGLSSHLHLRLALFYCHSNLQSKAATMMNRAIEFLSEDFLLPDHVNTRTYGGSDGSGSSVLAAADLILLIRCMLLRDDDTSAVLLPALPDEWYTSKRGLVVENLPTTFDRARIEIGMSANQHQIELGASRLPEEIEVHVPAAVPVSMVKAYGASIVDRVSKGQSPHLKAVPLSDTVVFTFFR